MKRLLVGLVVLALACKAPEPQIVTVVDSARCDSLSLVIDSLTARIDEGRVLFRLTEQQAKRYAAIVARDPSQAVFLRGWMNRAFAGGLPE